MLSLLTLFILKIPNEILDIWLHWIGRLGNKDNNNSSSIMNRKLSKSIMLFKIKINIIKDKTNR